MSLPIDLILEAMLAALLVITAAYCVILDRKLRQLRSGQDGLRDIIKGLNGATERAQSAISQLKVAGEAHARDLKTQIAHAKALTDELGLMIESGNSLADRLEGGRNGLENARRRGTDAGAGVEPLWAAREAGANGRETPPGSPQHAFEDRLRRALRDAR
ncbi:MAG: DUF6468 domain-containing protein [Alphaproteobacteria bacterium]